MTPDEWARLVVVTLKQALAPVRATVASLDERTAAAQARLTSLDGLRAELTLLRERIAVLETRAPVPGPPGRDGVDGVKGADGVGFDDLAVDYDGDRTVTLRFVRGETSKAFPLVLPIPRYQGTFSAAQTYRVGDVVTWGGSAWHCQLPTSAKPDDHATAWRLMVKHGRDGRDLKAEPH